MKRIIKRFVALLIVFISTLSLLPVEFFNNLQVANAAENDTTIITVESGQDVKNIGMHLREYSGDDDAEGKEVSSSAVSDGKSVFVKEDGGTITYGIAIDDITLSDDQIKTLFQNAVQNNKNDNTNKRYEMSVIVSEDIKVTSINQISANNLKDASIKVDDRTSYYVNGKKWYYKKITNMPYGINRIIYTLTATRVKYIYDPASGSISKETTVDNQGNEIEKTTEEVVKTSDMFFLYNGTKYVDSQVKELTIDQYVGDSNDFNKDELIENNTRPFLYTSKVNSISGIPLKYEWSVPDSTNRVDYNFKFGFDLTGAEVFVNGVQQENISIGLDESNKHSIVTGSLDRNNSTYYIVITINGKEDNNGNKIISKSYSIQINFPAKNSEDDYSIKEAGIKKYNYNDDEDVKAYIGKKFSHIVRTDGVSEYTGEITIDPKAYMISLEPELVRSKSNTAYVLTNLYSKNGTNNLKRESEIKDGRQFVEFNYGDENILNLEIYEGDNGNRTGKLLAVYKLKVNVIDGDSFKTNLEFNDGDTDKAWLTQLGVPENKIEPFSPNRTNYNLYLKDTKSLKIALTDIPGNEYIRVFYSTSTSGDSFEEFDTSKDKNKSEIIVNITDKIKRIKVQAYYNQIDKENGTFTRRKLGREYIFYVADNIDENNGDGNISNSDYASLANIKIKGETLKDSEGNTGFSSSCFDYEVKVDKDKKEVLLTVTPEDENVKSMIATVKETGTVLDLYSGEQTEITLSESGTTTVDIEVTAQDGKTKMNYTVVIVNNSKSGNALLENIVLSTGDFKFNPSEYDTYVYVYQTTKKISITPIAKDAKAKVTVDGQVYANTAISVSLTGSQKKEVEITVTSEDGKNKKTYTLIIKKVTSTPDDNDDPYGPEDDSYYDYDNDIWIDNSKYDEWGTTSDGRVVYYDTKGRQVKDAWIQTGDKYYYLNKSGYRASGWKIDTDGKTYYLDPSTGEMKTGWIYVNGSTYYLNPRGIMQKGWLNLNNKWYYFTSNGQMMANTSMYIDGQLYRFAQDGAMYY